MPEKEVIIKIDPQGKVSAEALGFEGLGCEDAIKLLTTQLGEIEQVIHKQEYYNNDDIQVNQDIGE